MLKKFITKWRVRRNERWTKNALSLGRVSAYHKVNKR